MEFAAVDAENALNVAELSEGDEALSNEITGVLGNLLGFVFNALANHAEPMTNKELAAEFGVSAQKMSAALRFLVKEGRVDRHEGAKKSDPATFTA